MKDHQVQALRRLLQLLVAACVPPQLSQLALWSGVDEDAIRSQLSLLGTLTFVRDHKVGGLSLVIFNCRMHGQHTILISWWHTQKYYYPCTSAVCRCVLEAQDASQMHSLCQTLLQHLAIIG